MEMLVAMSLLAAAMTMVGKFVHQVQAGLKNQELSARFDWELLNARERIGSWAEEQITVQQIQQIPISDSLSSQVTNAHFAASIMKIETPLPATQVTLAFECEVAGQTIQPSMLTFWVASPAEENP